MKNHQMKKLNNIYYQAGVYAREYDSEGSFQWLSNRVEIATSNINGVVTIQGESPVPCIARITTPQSTFNVILPLGPTTITIPVTEKNDSQQILVEFSNKLDSLGDSRTLCFKARELDFRLSNPESRSECDVPLVHGRGLLSGAVSATFADGWLRITAKRISDGRLKLSGILSPPLRKRDEIVLTANGQPVTDIQYGLYNPDYLFLGNVAFEGYIQLSDYFGESHIRFASMYCDTGKSATPTHQDWVWPLITDNYPLPQAGNMKRIGSLEADWFLFSGASFVEKLLEVTGNTEWNNIDVLDWGCGCGRLTRHLIDKGCESVTGIDIDPVNIEWCQNNLPKASFKLVKPDTPTALKAQQYDLVIGHSVFTHLGEADQFLWLAELNRLLKPGGHAVVTVMTNFSSAIESFNVNAYNTLQKYGFLDVGWQEDGVDSQKPGYYRRVFHTIDYVLSNWSLYFEIGGVLEGYSDHQNAILLEKRS